MKHRVDETQAREAWISRFEDATLKATEKGEDVKQACGGDGGRDGGTVPGEEERWFLCTHTSLLFYFRPCAVLVNGGHRFLVFSRQSVSVSVPGPAVIDVILTFLLSGVLLGLLQLLRQR